MVQSVNSPAPGVPLIKLPQKMHNGGYKSTEIMMREVKIGLLSYQSDGCELLSWKVVLKQLDFSRFE